MLTEKSAKEFEVLKDALKSGDFKKTEGTLHLEGGGFCCIGVDAIVNRGYTKEEIAVDHIEDGEGRQVVYDEFKDIYGSLLMADLTDLNDGSMNFDPVIEKIGAELEIFYAKSEDVKNEK